MIKPSGMSFEGKFEEDDACGFGKLRYPDGSSYIGEVKEFKKEGQGKMYYKGE